MTTAPAMAPDAALLRWAQSIPAVHCVAPAFRPWTQAKDSHAVPITATTGERFARTGFAGDVTANLTYVAGRSALGNTYSLARVPTAHAVVMHAGSEAMEDSFTAVVSGAPPPPRTVAALAASPKANGGLGLGSSRGDVERALGTAHAKSMCGYDVVRYEPRPPAASEAEMWFIYRAGRVVAFARYEAV